jgi:hypothetical protein
MIIKHLSTNDCKFALALELLSVSYLAMLLGGSGGIKDVYVTTR